jgi:hypothetical protein
MSAAPGRSASQTRSQTPARTCGLGALILNTIRQVRHVWQTTQTDNSRALMEAGKRRRETAFTDPCPKSDRQRVSIGVSECLTSLGDRLEAAEPGGGEDDGLIDPDDLPWDTAATATSATPRGGLNHGNR